GLDRPAPVLVGALDEGAVDDDAGIADQDVDLAEGPDGFGDQPFGVFTLRDVGLNDDRLAAGVVDFVRDLLRLVDGRDAAHRDMGAVAGKALGDRPADAARAAGDDCRLVLENHVLPPRLTPAD